MTSKLSEYADRCFVLVKTDQLFAKFFVLYFLLFSNVVLSLESNPTGTSLLLIHNKVVVESEISIIMYQWKWMQVHLSSDWWWLLMSFSTRISSSLPLLGHHHLPSWHCKCIKAVQTKHPTRLVTSGFHGCSESSEQSPFNLEYSFDASLSKFHVWPTGSNAKQFQCRSC